MSKIKEVEERVSALENNGVDTEVMRAVSGSVTGLLDKRDEEHDEALKICALNAIKMVLRAFPEATREAVVEAFDQRVLKAYSVGHRQGKNQVVYGQPIYDVFPKPVCSSVTVRDLLGQPDKCEGKE